MLQCGGVDTFAASRLALGTCFLAVAAVWDVRSRRVRDPLWVALGGAGLVLLLLELASESAGLDLYGLVAATAILFCAIFYGRPLIGEDGLRLRPARIGLFVLAAILVLASGFWAASVGGREPGAYAALLGLPAMVIVYQAFYQVGLLHGGADTKGLIALTLLIPRYPNADPFPLLGVEPRVQGSIQTFFPFSLVVLIDAALLFLVVPIAYLLLNASRGDLKLPQALFGTRASVSPLPAHVWLMERIDQRGNHVLVLFPRRGRDQEQEANRLRAAGATKAWVQPQVPFMIPLLAGFLLAFFAGNVLWAFLTAVLPHP
jgi:hypothetical protein